VSDEPDPYTTELRLERRIQASAEELYDAWTSAELFKRWWHAARNWETPFAEVEPRVGGRVRITMRNPADGREYGGSGEYTILDRPNRLAFTWTWDDDQNRRRQLIEVELLPQGDDDTLVVLTHKGLPEGETADYREGWDASFDNLEAALAS
jgi:uncharacterized protein YndB with AHSA1/START domain